MLRSLLVAFALSSPLLVSAPAAAAPSSANEWSAQACTREYRPVCAARRGGRPRTFSNPCVARNAGARIIHRGACRGGQQASPSVCTMEHRPVCARTRHGRHQTFSNACLARNAGARVVHRGACGGRR